MAEVQRYPPPPVLSKNPFPHSTFPVRGVTSGLLSSGMNWPVLAHNLPGWEGQPPPSPLQQLIVTPEGFLAKQRRKRLAEGGGGGVNGRDGAGGLRGADGGGADGLGGASGAGRGRRRGGRGGRAGAAGYGADAVGGADGGADDLQDDWFGGDGEDAAEEAAEEGLGIGMPVRVCNFVAPGTDCFNGLIGDVVKVQTVAEAAGEEEFLFTVRCLSGVQRRRTFSSVSSIPVSPMAQEAIEANRKVLRPGASDDIETDDLPPMVILDKLPSEKLEALS